MGLFQGLAAGLGGAAGPIERYGSQAREQKQQTAIQMREQAHSSKLELVRQLKDVLDKAPLGSQDYAQASDHMAKLLSTAVGDKSASQTMQKAFEFLHVHPENIQAGQAAGIFPTDKKIEPVPGPAQPGEVPGRGTMNPLASLIGGAGGGNGTTGGGGSIEPNPVQPQQVQPQRQQAPAAAQPATSPIQPSAQGGGGIGIPPVQASAPPQPQAQASSISDVLNQRAMSDLNAGNTLSPGMMNAISPAMRLHEATQEDIRKQREEAQMRMGMIEQHLGGMDPRMANIARIEALTGHPMTGMLNTIFAPPQQRFVDANSLTPEEKTRHGIPPDAKGKWTVQVDRFGQTVGSNPGWSGMQTVTGAGGEQGMIDKNNPGGAPVAMSAPGGGPAVIPALARPRVFTGPNGEQFYESPAQAAQGTAGTSVPGAVNPAFIPTQTKSSHTTIKNINGEMVPVTEGASSSRSKGGGIPAVSGGAGGIPPVSRGAGGGGGISGAGPHVGVGAPIGDSQATHNMKVQNQLSPPGQKIMATAQSTMAIMDRLKQAIEPYKDSDVPATTLLPRIAYAMGYGGDYGKMLSALELSDLSQAGSVLSGASIRSNLQTLNRALIHTPNAWKDSPKLMMDKINTIQDNIRDVQKATMDQMKKYPGLDQMPSPPSGGNSSASAGPKVGTVEGGYRFKGGNPSDKSNWEKVH